MDSRKKAKAEGRITYTSTKACKHCGSHEKYTSTYSCYPCAKAVGLEKLKDKELMAPYRTNEKQWKRLKQWRRENPDKVKSQQDRMVEYHKKYYVENKDACRNRMLTRNYNITLEVYNKMLCEQSGVCAICHETCSSGKQLAVDHCHDTEKIRGLLCTRCNTAIGLLRNEDIMIEAIEYLRRYK